MWGFRFSQQYKDSHTENSTEGLICYKIKYTVLFVTTSWYYLPWIFIYVQNSFLLHHSKLTVIISQQYHEDPDQIVTNANHQLLFECFHFSTQSKYSQLSNFQNYKQEPYRSIWCSVIKPDSLESTYNIKLLGMIH